MTPKLSSEGAEKIQPNTSNPKQLTPLSFWSCSSFFWSTSFVTPKTLKTYLDIELRVTCPQLPLVTKKICFPFPNIFSRPESASHIDQISSPRACILCSQTGGRRTSCLWLGSQHASCSRPGGPYGWTTSGASASTTDRRSICLDNHSRPASILPFDTALLRFSLLHSVLRSRERGEYAIRCWC
jgi:hypothetical protein